MAVMDRRTIRVGMAGLGMIFDETYRPFLLAAAAAPLFDSATGPVAVELKATATRTGARAAGLTEPAFGAVSHFTGGDAAITLARAGADVVCVATPDDRHFAPALAAIEAGKH